MRKKQNKREGVALLVALLIIMAVTIISLGFLSKSDMQMLSGGNMELRAKMDYLAESGLDHARGLILNPTGVAMGGSPYWTGATRQQLDNTSYDYYDVTVVRDVNSSLGRRFVINSTAYREKGSTRIAQSQMTADMWRPLPLFSYWAGVGGGDIPTEVSITGDVYIADNVVVNGTITGDLYATGSITGAVGGYEFPNTSAITRNWRTYADFAPTYFIDSNEYTATEICGTIQDTVLGPTAGNPAGVYYCLGNTWLFNNVTVNGTLVSGNDTKVEDVNCVITAIPEYGFPAMFVGRDFYLRKNADVVSNGDIEILGEININGDAAAARLTVNNGGMYAQSGGYKAVSASGIWSIVVNGH